MYVLRNYCFINPFNYHVQHQQTGEGAKRGPQVHGPPPPTPLFLDQVHGPGHALPILFSSEKFFLRDTDVYINRGGIHEL